MANPNAPHGLQPVAYTNGAPWTGKANLYYIASADTLAYYIGDIVQFTNTTDANGVPGVTGFAAGAVTTAAAAVGPIVGVMVAPIGTGAGNPQGQNVNLNVLNVPATKTYAYYVWVADDPNLVFEIQANNTGNMTGSAVVGFNAGFTQAAPATTFGPVSGTVLTAGATGGSITTTNTLPLKIIGLPQRVNVTAFGANCPLLVRWNTHYFTVSTGVTGV